MKDKKEFARQKKETHGETCLCKRCRARYQALSRRNLKPLIKRLKDVTEDDY
jgi:hypothetical protein